MRQHQIFGVPLAINGYLFLLIVLVTERAIAFVFFPVLTDEEYN